MNKEWTTVEVLRHARHDWLNKIQLIKGNLSLNKVDRVNEIIDEIVAEARQESALSNLKIPQFADLLLTYNWENHYVHLEYEVLEEKNHSAALIDDGLITKWTRSFLQNLNSSIQVFHENHLSVTIEQQQKGIRFFFDFRGIITNQKQIMAFLQGHSSIVNNVGELSEQELAFELFLPFH